MSELFVRPPSSDKGRAQTRAGIQGGGCVAEEDSSDPDNAREAAIEWWVSRKAGPLSREEQAEFETWLARDPANAAAFDDISRMFEHVRGMRPSRRRDRAVTPSRRHRLAGAASLAAASLALFIAFDDLSAFLKSDYYVGAGETKLVTLEDGSRAQLDGKSAIAVHYDAGKRRLTLLEGEAWFEVAPNPARPFVVEAAGATVTAHGTAFDVALDNAGARVTVTEHRVSVLSGGVNVVVAEGQQSSFDRNSVALPPSPVDAESVTAWRRGKLIVEDRPLGEVLAALSRYHRGYVYCIQAATCARSVTGVFGTNNPLRALQEIEASLGLHAIHLTNYMIFLSE